MDMTLRMYTNPMFVLDKDNLHAHLGFRLEKEEMGKDCLAAMFRAKQ
jgi:hypothetical protein